MVSLQKRTRILGSAVCVFVAMFFSVTEAATTHDGDLDVPGPYLVIGNFGVSGGNLTVQNGGTLTTQPGTGEEGDLFVIASGDATKGNANVYFGGSIQAAGYFGVEGYLRTYTGGAVQSNELVVLGTLVNAGQTGVVTSYTNPSTSKLENSGTFIVGEDLINEGWIDGDGTIQVGRALICEPGSLLSGYPTLSGPNLYLNGTVDMSGDGVGTTTLSGNTWLAGDTYFDVRISPDSGSDQFHVTALNKITLVRNADESRPNFYLPTPYGATPQIGERRTLIATDRADGLTLAVRPRAVDPLSDFRFILRTDLDIETFGATGHHYYAYLGRDSSFETMGQTTNQRSFGRYLDTVKETDDGEIDSALADFQWVRDTLDLMTDLGDVRDAMEQLCGVTYAPLSTVSMQRQFFQYNQMADRLRRDLRFRPTWGGSADPDQRMVPHSQYIDSGEAVLDQVLRRGQSPENAPWLTHGRLSGIGFGGDLESDGNAYGGSYGGGGMQLAFGVRQTPRFTFGTFYQYGGIDYSGDKNGSAAINSHDFGGYFTLHDTTRYFLFLAGGGFSGYDVKRTLDFGNDINWIHRTAHGDHDGGQATVYAEYGLQLDGFFSGLWPYVGLMYMNVSQSAFTETGANGANLALEENHLNSLRTLLGAAWDKPLFGNPAWALNARALWVHELLKRTRAETTARLAPIPEATFVVLGPSADRDWAVVGTGLQFFHSDNASRFYVNADVMLNGSSNIFLGTAGWEYLR